MFACVACASAFVPGSAILPGATRYQSNARSGLSLRGGEPGAVKGTVKMASGGQSNKDKEPATIVNVVVDSEAHTTLKALVTRAGLVEALQGAGKFTLFAPTNTAFASLGDSTLVKKITADPISDNFKPLLQDVSCCYLRCDCCC